jgi:hypothetical protein
MGADSFRTRPAWPDHRLVVQPDPRQLVDSLRRQLACPSGWTGAALCRYPQATAMRNELDREEDGRWLTEITPADFRGG